MNKHRRGLNQSKIIIATISSKFQLGYEGQLGGKAMSKRIGITPNMNVHHMFKSALKYMNISAH